MRIVGRGGAFLLALAVWAGAAPGQVFDITGVQPPDELNIRANIDAVEHFSEAPVIGRFPRDATGVRSTGRSVLLRGARWREVWYGGQPGWVNQRFLRLRYQQVFPSSNAFSCSGTEPFWSFDFNESLATARLWAEDRTEQLRVVDWTGAAGRTDIRTYAFRRRDGPEKLLGILHFNDRCSDGASDYDYAYELYLVGLGDGISAYHACCTTR